MTAPEDAPDITRVEVPVDTHAPGGTTNAYVVDGLVVDPAARTDALDAAVGVGDASNSAAPGIDAIAVTHTHPDHVGAVAEYADLTDAAVVAHAPHVDRFVAATGVEPDETFETGARESETGARVADTGVRAVATPGHAVDHVAFAVGDRGETGGDGHESFRALLCGDLAIAEGSVVVGGPGADLRAYLDSLERVRDGDYDKLYPGHGPPVTDPAATCQRLIDHRLERERTVIDAIENGASDIDAIVDAAYEKDLTGVEDLARATVVAHVEKLVAGGRISSAWTERTER